MLTEAAKNIVLVDDHAVICDGLKSLIEKLGPYKISYQFNRGDEFIATIPELPKPDLIILDLYMPGMNGDEVMERLEKMRFSTPVLLLTTCDEEETITKLFKYGIKGYLRKTCTAKELKTALEEIFHMGEEIKGN